MQLGVLHICLSKGWGGLEQYPLSLAGELAAQGVRVHYWALRGTRFAQKAQALNASMLTFAGRWALLWQLFGLCVWLRSSGIQVIHFHKSSDLRFAPLFAWLLPHVRLVFTEHMNAKRPKHSIYHLWVYRCLHQVIAISDYSLANNLRALPVRPQHIQRLYAGINLQLFKPSLSFVEREQLRASLGLQSQDIACCLPGRISPGKGHAVFLDAVVDWAQQHPGPGKARAFIVGGLVEADGADEALVTQLQARVRELGAEHYITFTGYSAQMNQLLQAMDMVCIPSTQEAFGLAVVEAMALGLPVVGSNSGAIPEILGHNGDYGLLAEPNNPASFAQAFQQLAASLALRQSIGQQALARVQSTFNLKDHVSRLLHIYRT
jgi:glycosyltransferase involved in cell wall biosynthesis